MPPIFLILGAPAAGKSTVPRALMARFPRGLHLPVNDLRQMVVLGRAEVSFDWTDELSLYVKAMHKVR